MPADGYYACVISGREGGRGGAYALVMTPEVRAWLHDLRHRDKASALLVGQAIGMLTEARPTPGARSPTGSGTRG